MKPFAYALTLVLGLVSAGLSLTLILLARSNQALDASLQRNQQALNSSVLGPQAQQISTSVLQDMAAAAASNSGMRALLAKYGMRVEPSKTPAAAALEAVKQKPGSAMEKSAPAATAAPAESKETP